MQIAMSFNGLEIIHKDAFNGVKEVRTLFLKDNQLHTIEEGTLDVLVNLQHLDVRNNPNLTSYTTNAWHFCTMSEEFNLHIDSPTFYKNFKTSKASSQYCDSKMDFPFDGCVRNGDGIIDCTSVEDFSSTPCKIKNEDFNNIMINYPKDKEAKVVENYYEGESNRFFQEFNSQKGSMEHAKYMLELTLYETKYDLTKLKELTSDMTELVTIKADTVYMSSPVTISHHLNIQARVVALDYPITMNMTKHMFTSNPEVEAWAHKEENYFVGKVLMNKRTFGLVTVLQNALELPPVSKDDVCTPQVSKVEETRMDVSSWFDVTAINLQYVCAMTVMKTRNNAKLVEDMSHYMLDFVYDSAVVGSQKTFIAAQKFNRVLDLNKMSSVHNVPAYSIDIVSSLAGLMYDRMMAYQQNEINQEIQLADATNIAQMMQTNFEMVKMQQQQYFSQELAVLDSIWAAADNNWNFDFDHRNGIEDQIGASMDAIQNQIFEMQEQALKQALTEAEMSQQHIDDVIDQYKKQITRLNDLVTASVDVQSKLMERLKDNTNNLEIEFDKFEQAVEDWKHEQEVKAVFAIFKAVFTFGIGLATGNPEDLDIGEVIGDIMEIFDLLMELVEIIESCQDIQDMINDLDLDHLADINLNLGTSFKDSLQTMVKLKLKGSDFDELDRTATIKLTAMNQATDFGISGADDCMMAMTRVTDVGKQMITEAAEFSDIVLKLSEESDKLTVAQEDRERTTKQIEDIKNQVRELEEFKEQFTADREKAKEEYEKQIEEMKAKYENITEEMRAEFREKIELSFKNFQDSFASLSKSYERQIFYVKSSIHQKFYGLKEHSMTQRAMILSLYLDYCDAEYFNSFKSCDDQSLPYMSDDLETLLDKLIEIQWESVVSDAEIPGKPVEFIGRFDVDSNTELVYGGVKNYYVDTLRSTYHMDLNIKDLDIYNRFDDFWRIRIDTMKLLLLDADDNPIDSAGTSTGEEIQIKIQYPTVFNDTDYRKNANSFLAQNSACNSDYVTTPSGKCYHFFVATYLHLL